MEEEDEIQRVRAQYSKELATAKQRLADLKAQFLQRAESRRKVRSSDYWSERLGGSYVDWENQDAAAHATRLEKLMALALLDNCTTLPLAEEVLHQRLLTGANGAHFQQHLSALGLNSSRKPLLRLDKANAGVTVVAVAINGVQQMCITHINRARLCEEVGVVDPFPPAPPSSPPAPPLPGPPHPPVPSSPAGHQFALPQQMFQPGGMPGVMPPSGFLPAPPPVPLPQPPPGAPPPPQQQQTAGLKRKPDDALENLLQFQTVRDRGRLERGEEVLELLDKPTARQAQQREVFKSQGGSAIAEHCAHLTKEACRAATHGPVACPRVHFRKVLYPWTDERLGNCSFLNSCRNPKSCRHVHYELDTEPDVAQAQQGLQRNLEVPAYLKALPEGQWINCDVRSLDLSILGKFGVIMTDPPWEIHQDLPYGTMKDDELRGLNMGCLQDDGVIFMWVTGRAMELGRELLHKWGYDRVDELIWVKTNMLQRLIRTGRTGHWLNHSKEHCLVGVKGNPQLNRLVDADVLVAPVRRTSQKPDEMYALLERLSPGTRKLEIFARQHNIFPGWIGLGNQLNGDHIVEPDMLKRYMAVYGPPKPQQPNWRPID